MAYKQRCIACKKNMVLITYYKQRPVCMECEMKDINEPIENPKWKKFFDIDPELYQKSSFLRSIKRNYLRQGTLTPKQKEIFLKVVKEGAKGFPKKKKVTKIRTIPKNKELFMRLKEFCKEILDICKSISITPVTYGSLAYFAYTKNKRIDINDFDFLVPENAFKKIIPVLKKKKIKHEYTPEKHTLKIFKDDLKIDFDSVEHWHEGTPKDLKEYDFGGLILTVLSLADLQKNYEKAAETCKKNPEEYRKKFFHLST